MGTAEELSKLNTDLDYILSLGKDGLLKSEKMYETIYGVEDKLKELGKELDERSQLAIEKAIPTWRNVPRTGIFVRNEEVIQRTSPIKAVITELISKQSPNGAIKTEPEMVITAGQPYEGRLYLRNILSQATNSIFIRDSYFRPEVLDTLLEYLLDNNALKVEILMGDNQRLTPFKASYLSFKTQYPTFNLEARYSTSADGDHPRYILIDDQLLFNPDHSLDQWGQKTVNVHQMVQEAEIQKVKDKLQKDWTSANIIQ